MPGQQEIDEEIASLVGPRFGEGRVLGRDPVEGITLDESVVPDRLERDPERRDALEFEVSQMQLQVEQLLDRQRELEARRLGFAEAYERERERYEDLDNRLYQLEREVARSR